MKIIYSVQLDNEQKMIIKEVVNNLEDDEFVILLKKSQDIYGERKQKESSLWTY